MPELPEVETIKNALIKEVVGKKIKDVKVNLPRMVFPSKDKFISGLKEKAIRDLRRIGKYIVFTLDSGYLAIHLGMTGHVRIADIEEAQEKHTHIVFTLDGSYTPDGDKEMRYIDVRQLGELYYTDDLNNIEGIKKMGPDPFGKIFTVDYLQSVLKNKKTKIKQVLMDQSIIGGIGNIYGDEILFQAGIHPERPANNVKDYRKLSDSIKDVLQKAIKDKGTAQEGTYMDPYGSRGEYINQVHQREGEPCLVCKTPIKRIKIGGRSSYFCPHCQH